VNYRYPEGYRLPKGGWLGHKTKVWKQTYVGKVMTPRVAASDPGDCRDKLKNSSGENCAYRNKLFQLCREEVPNLIMVKAMRWA
jgi:hypothetical protein